MAQAADAGAVKIAFGFANPSPEISRLRSASACSYDRCSEYAVFLTEPGFHQGSPTVTCLSNSQRFLAALSLGRGHQELMPNLPTVGPESAEAHPEL